MSAGPGPGPRALAASGPGAGGGAVAARTAAGSRTAGPPDFLIVGAAKSGTSTLYQHLRAHDRVFMPDLKEPWFFAFADEPSEARRLRPGALLPRSFEEYLHLFAGARPDQVTGEASTIYLYLHRRSIEGIRRHVPGRREIRIVIVLRDPVERAWSHYRHAVRDGRETGTFAEAVGRWERGEVPPHRNYLLYGLYHEQVRAYLAEFEHVRVHLFDDLIRRPREVVADTCAFLGIPPPAALHSGLRANPSGAPRSRALLGLLHGRDPVKRLLKPLVPSRTRVRLRNWAAQRLVRPMEREPGAERRLREVYRADTLRLQDLLGRDLSGWLG